MNTSVSRYCMLYVLPLEVETSYQGTYEAFSWATNVLVDIISELRSIVWVRAEVGSNLLMRLKTTKAYKGN